ncbi:MAG: glycoside hydrolase family 2 TIM barrel-domain containing protein [Kiritimatiellia bacterium]
MRIPLLLALVFPVIPFLAVPFANGAILSLDGEGWCFTRNPQRDLDVAAVGYDDSAWKMVEIPHDWAIAGPFQPDGDGNTGKLPWQGIGWYRKKIELPYPMVEDLRSGGVIWLEFDGVMARPKVWLNGHFVGGWDYGYIGFRLDVSKWIKEGPNTLVVQADTRNHHSRWYPGAGIYRSVRLQSAPGVHIVPDSAVIISQIKAQNSAQIKTTFSLENRLPQPQKVSVSLTIEPRAQSSAATASQLQIVEIPPKGILPMTFDCTLPHPKLWDINDPNLYVARIEVKSNERIDRREINFGIREARFTAHDGFYLNGRRVQLKGVNLHSDMGPLGMAFNRDIMRRQLNIMLDMGINALRTSHNACDPLVLDLCDELGIVVWNECFDKWDGTAGILPGEPLEPYVIRNLQAFVKRDRNHPCVIAWSIGNEIFPDPCKTNVTNPQELNGTSAMRFRLFRNAIREFDITRPIGIGCCHPQAIATGMFEELDLSGWNYGAQYRLVKAKHPDKPTVYTESASALSSNGHFTLQPPSSKTDYDLPQLEVDAYEHNAAPWSDIPDIEFARMEADKYCAGEFVWTGIDYLGEPTPYLQPGIFSEINSISPTNLARSSYFGIADLMGFPKDRYWLYRSHWNTNAHTLHISPHWTWFDRPSSNRVVYIYTDGDEAELFLNGTSLGRRRKGESQQAVNLAIGKTATDNSAQTNPSKSSVARLALDENLDTLWYAENATTGSWWQVDLGRATTFRTLGILPEADSVKYGWTVLTSTDGQAWFKHSSKAIGYPFRPHPKATTARYIRIVFDALETGLKPALREFSASPSTEPCRANPYYAVCDRYRLRWFEVPYQPGELKAIAYQKGKPIAETAVRTSGQPVALRLTDDPYNAHDAQTRFIQVDLVDANGVRHPWGTNRVSFAITGPGKILAVGNANPRGLDSFADVDSHPLYYGRAAIVIRRTAPGTISLTARAKGLADGVLMFDR